MINFNDAIFEHLGRRGATYSHRLFVFPDGRALPALESNLYRHKETKEYLLDWDVSSCFVCPPFPLLIQAVTFSDVIKSDATGIDYKHFRCTLEHEATTQTWEQRHGERWTRIM